MFHILLQRTMMATSKTPSLNSLYEWHNQVYICHGWNTNNLFDKFVAFKPSQLANIVSGFIDWKYAVMNRSGNKSSGLIRELLFDGGNFCFRSNKQYSTSLKISRESWSNWLSRSPPFNFTWISQFVTREFMCQNLRFWGARYTTYWNVGFKTNSF